MHCFVKDRFPVLHNLVFQKKCRLDKICKKLYFPFKSSDNKEFPFSMQEQPCRYISDKYADVFFNILFTFHFSCVTNYKTRQPATQLIGTFHPMIFFHFFLRGKCRPLTIPLSLTILGHLLYNQLCWQ